MFDSSDTHLKGNKKAHKLERTAEVLGRLDADLVHLAEVQSCHILSQLASLTNSSYEPFLVKGTDAVTGQQVGLLSRIPPLSRLWRTDKRSPLLVPGSTCGHDESIKKGETTGVSKHLVARFSPVDGHEIIVIGVHLRAFQKPHSCHVREGQARVLQGLIRGFLGDGKHVVVLGDFNDYDPDVKVPREMKQKPTGSVLHMLKDVDGDGSPDLWNVNEDLPTGERYSSWVDRNRDGKYDGSERERSLIDHILLSESLYRMVEKVGIDHHHDPSQLSDHWPVWVRLDLSPWVLGQPLPPSHTPHNSIFDRLSGVASIVPAVLAAVFGAIYCRLRRKERRA